jgi:hypothetical protein
MKKSYISETLITDNEPESYRFEIDLLAAALMLHNHILNPQFEDLQIY